MEGFKEYKDMIADTKFDSLINFVPGAYCKYHPLHIKQSHKHQNTEFLVMGKKLTTNEKIIRCLNIETGSVIYLDYKKLIITKYENRPKGKKLGAL